MTSFRFPAMGTEVEVWGASDEARGTTMAWFEQVEACCSRFRPDSELSRVNRDPARVVSLSALLADLLRAADRARHLTGGLVDAGVGAVIENWGYDRTFAEVTDLDVVPTPVDEGDWVLLGESLDRSPGLKLDLGGIAKGWACDRAVEGGLASVVSAGGDLRSDHPDTVAAITDQSGAVVTRVHVGRGALATSSTSRRRWRVAGTEVSHLIDPRSMRPVRSPVVSATVVAPTAADAEAGAKGVLLLGVDGLAWAAEKPWIDAALVVWDDGSVYGTPGLEAVA